MAYNQQYQGGYNPQGYAPKGQQRQQKEVLNKAEYTGIVRPLSKNENDPVKFFPFKNGGGIIHFVLKVTEPYLDANGQPRYNEQGQPMVITTPINVDVRTNKNITPEMLSSVVAGMKVHVVGRTRHSAYKDPKTNEDKFKEICDAYVFNILAGPMEQAYGGYGSQYGQQPQMPPQQAPYGGFQGGYPQYPGPQGGYAPQAPAPQQAQMAPQQPPYGGYPGGYPQYPARQGEYVPQAPAPAQAPQQPAYGRQPQQAQSQRAPQQSPAPATPPYYQPAPPPAGGAPVVDDLPEDMPEFPADAPRVRDINI